jgi:hypothetical protein
MEEKLDVSFAPGWDTFTFPRSITGSDMEFLRRENIYPLFLRARLRIVHDSYHEWNRKAMSWRRLAVNGDSEQHVYSNDDGQSSYTAVNHMSRMQLLMRSPLKVVYATVPRSDELHDYGVWMEIRLNRPSRTVKNVMCICALSKSPVSSSPICGYEIIGYNAIRECMTKKLSSDPFAAVYSPGTVYTSKVHPVEIKQNKVAKIVLPDIMNLNRWVYKKESRMSNGRLITDERYTIDRDLYNQLRKKYWHTAFSDMIDLVGRRDDFEQAVWNQTAMGRVFGDAGGIFDLDASDAAVPPLA